ncbi:MAG: hypothetical protein GXO04_04535, partial [Aquificae bacterium]|nr:hypothetical protein [Aquificota bacterium]
MRGHLSPFDLLKAPAGGLSEEELLKKASNKHFRRRLILVKRCLEVLERAFRGEEVNR